MPDTATSIRTAASIVDGVERTDAPGGRLESTNPANLSDVVADVLLVVLKSRGDFEGAARAAQRALQLRPDFFQAHVNLAHTLLALGRFAEAWKHYSARPHPRVNLRDPHLAVTVDHANRLPVRPSPIVLHGEQGLGDTLFFLRFAPGLRALGHRLAFWGDPRLHPILSRAGIFEHFLHPDSMPAPGLATVWVGDLPLFFGAHDPTHFPAALPLAPDKNLRDAAERRLAAFGPAPYIGLTWRAGLPRQGRVALSKNVEPQELGRALEKAKGTLVSMQRNPDAGEVARLASAAARPIHDASDVNADLDQALALLDVLDDYVTVSNTNVHLRASLGRGARVLVPWPPEWRWLEGADRSPWFARMTVYRQSRGGEWKEALERLARDV